MSSIGSTTAPVVPLSTLLDPAATTGTTAPAATTETPPVVPPAYSGAAGRGYSAISFGLAPPPPGGITEAELALVKQVLEETRDEVRAQEAEAAKQRAWTNEQLMAGHLARIEGTFETLLQLEFVQLPAAGLLKIELQGGVNSAQQALNQALGELGQMLDNFAAALVDAITGALEGLGDLVDAIGDLAGKALSELEEIARSLGLGDVVDALKAPITAFEENVVNPARQALEDAIGALNAAIQRQKDLESQLNWFTALFVSLLGALPIFAALARSVPDEIAPGQQSVDAVTDKEGEKSTQEVSVIVRTAVADRADAELVSDALMQESTDLDAVRIRQVGFAFAQIYTSLQQALTAMEDALEKMPQAPGDLASENETRVRLELSGRA